MKTHSKIISFNPTHERTLALLSAILLFLLIVLGGMVRVTGSAGACPDWPTCFGQWTPPADQSALVNYLHRALALVAALAVIISAAVTWRRQRRLTWVTMPLILAAALMGIQVAIGGVLSQISGETARLAAAGIHFCLSLLALASVVTAVVAVYSGNNVNEQVRLRLRSGFARLALATMASLAVLLISGVVVTYTASTGSCSVWPVCFPDSPGAWISLSHRLIVALTAGLMIALLVKAWTTQRTHPAILTASTAAFVLFFAQALLGSKLTAGYPVYLLALHQATAVATWASVGVLVAAVVLADRTAGQDQQDQEQLPIRRMGVALLRDFLMLTKPIVVALLLVTTFAGMVIGAQAWPSLKLVFWTLLGGFMAAGGSGAINQYIDRDDDEKMQRTQKRPIPSGRLAPAEGLAFGVGLALASFYLMTAYVNFLAAMLSLAGIIYYVLIYSIFLKKATVQNIVIGGGAGAIPPLVGWAAATGGLNVPSLFLFAVIFMWTPPHFWALALVRQKDYARAGVPMLPVIRGEKVTRWQIFLYTLELVGLTLLLPVFGLGGSIYLIGAAVLGLWLISAAWIVWKRGGNKPAWKMYRYSSMYLAFIFLVLMIDRLM